MALTRRAHRTIAASLGAGVLAALAVALPTTTAGAAEAGSSGCADAEMVIARGTGENTDTGIQKQIADLVSKNTSKTIQTYGLPYKAGLDMGGSALGGDKMLGAYINRQAAKCPDQKFALMGYSQGAWVVGDALTGGSTLAGGTGPTISREAGRQIAAIVLFGDPRFTAGESFNRGTFTSGKEGNFPRPMGAYGDYAKRLRSYCDGNDQTCQNVAGLGHLGYWPKYNDDASSFILGRLGVKNLPEPVKDTKSAEVGGDNIPPAVRDQVEKTVRELMKRGQDGLGKAASDGPSAGSAPSSSTAPAPAAPKQDDGKHWWDTVVSWLNPFD